MDIFYVCLSLLCLTGLSLLGRSHICLFVLCRALCFGKYCLRAYIIDVSFSFWAVRYHCYGVIILSALNIGKSSGGGFNLMLFVFWWAVVLLVFSMGVVKPDSSCKNSRVPCPCYPVLSPFCIVLIRICI